MKEYSMIGIDLAKNVFQVAAMNKAGKVVLQKKVSRNKLLSFVANLPCDEVAMEACGGSQYWARKLRDIGKNPHIMSAFFVKPFVKSQKNDCLDAEAICEAALRPQMRFIGIRSEEQQDIQNLHKIRERLLKNRTAISNQIRGFLLEYGITIPKGFRYVKNRLPSILEENKSKQSCLWYETLSNLYQELCFVCSQIDYYEKRLKQIAGTHGICRLLCEIPGIGYLTATAILASVANPKEFKNGRQFSAWVGLVPRQNSTGGKTKLLGITKRGNKYLRKLLVHGARSEVVASKKSNSPTRRWVREIIKRRGYNKAVIALANKNARRIWSVLNTGERFEEGYVAMDLAA